MSDLQLTALLRALDEHGVDCVVIGGVAVGLHGHARATKDLDIIIDPDPANVEREMPLPFEPKSIIEGGGNWLLSTRFGRLDVMQYAEGAPDYETLVERSEQGAMEGLTSPIRVCSLEDLLAMKRAAGRAVDLGDIERLELIHRRDDGA